VRVVPAQAEGTAASAEGKRRPKPPPRFTWRLSMEKTGERKKRQIEVKVLAMDSTVNIEILGERECSPEK